MKTYLILSFLLLSTVLSAQNINVSGIVKDSLGNPLEMANIIASKKADGSMEAYAITNFKGEYQLTLPGAEGFILRATFLGLKPAEIEIIPAVDRVDQTVNFILNTDENLLNEVEVVYEMPVSMRGDTLVYDADFFSNGTEKKLSDILKKMPGIDVNENGEIEVEGKKVSKVTIEGKDFFDGDSKLASQNIPADAVSKVEVLKDQNEVSQMRGLGNDEANIVINLKLKEGKKNFWFGEVEAAAGEGEGTRYAANSRLFYYSPKGSLNFIGNSNNIGEVPFTFRDYYNFTGGFPGALRGGSNNTLNEGDLGFLSMQNNKAQESKSHFAAANFTYEVTSKWNISGSAIVSDNYTGFINNTRKTYISNGLTEFNISESQQKNMLPLAKISSVYKPHSRFQFDYDLLAKNPDQQESTEAVSFFTDNTELNPIFELRKNDPFSINQQANLYYTLNENNIFALYMRQAYKKEKPFYRAITQVQPFTGIIPLEDGPEGFNINQNKELKSNKFSARVEYYYVLNKKSNININLGARHNRENFNSSLFQVLNSEEYQHIEEGFLNNDLAFNFSDVFFGLKYRVKSGIFTISPELTFHNYRTNAEEVCKNTLYSKKLLLPAILAIAAFKKNESLRFNYRMSAEFAGISDYAEGYILSNYNKLFRGNSSLKNGVFHNINLSYLNFNMFNLSNIYIGLNYNIRDNAIRTTSSIEQINIVSTRINSNFIDDSFSAYGRFEKSFKKFKIKANSNLLVSNYNNLVNDLPMESRDFTQSYEGSILSNFKKSPHLELGHSRRISAYENGKVKNMFYTNRTFANIEIGFLNVFNLTAEWSYYNYFDKEKTIKNNYSFIDAGLVYELKESKWEFSIKCYNLLNVDRLNRDSFNENFNSTTAYFVQPRIVMATVKFKL